MSCICGTTSDVKVSKNRIGKTKENQHRPVFKGDLDTSNKITMAKDKQINKSKMSKEDKKKEEKAKKEEEKQRKSLAKEEKKRSKEERKKMKEDQKKSKSSTNVHKEDKKKDKSKKDSKSKSKSSKDKGKYVQEENEQAKVAPKPSSSYPFLPTRFELPRGQKGYVFPVTPGPARYPVTRINYPIMKARRQVDLTKKMIAGPSPPAYTMGIRHTEFREFYNKIQ